jgi:hypothetical protein
LAALNAANASKNRRQGRAAAPGQASGTMIETDIGGIV